MFVCVEDRLLKPLGGFTGHNMEMRELAQLISRASCSLLAVVRFGTVTVASSTSTRPVTAALCTKLITELRELALLISWAGIVMTNLHLPSNLRRNTTFPCLRFKPCAWLLCTLSSVCMYVSILGFIFICLSFIHSFVLPQNVITKNI